MTDLINNRLSADFKCGMWVVTTMVDSIIAPIRHLKSVEISGRDSAPITLLTDFPGAGKCKFKETRLEDEWGERTRLTQIVAIGAPDSTDNRELNALFEACIANPVALANEATA